MNRILGPEGKWIRLRMGILTGFLGLSMGLVVTSAHELMIVEGPAYRELAERQRERRLSVRPKRGMILDRNKSALAVSVEVPTISLDALELLRGVREEDVPRVADDAARRLAAALDLPPEVILKKILAKRRWTWLERAVSDREVEEIRKLMTGENGPKIAGLLIEGEPRRFFPRRELASALVGFVAPDGKGKDGLEYALNSELEGHAEEIRGLRDRSGKLIFTQGIDDDRAFAGHNIELALDQAIQHEAEVELENAVRTFEAVGGSVVVVDPKTGEILALASAPGYNLNDYGKSEPEARRNRPVADAFEPGSTVKIFTIAAALEARKLEPTETLFCENGSMKIDNVTIRDTHPAGMLALPQVLAQSSNICAAKVGLSLGGEKLYEAFRRFGFGEKSGVPVAFESAGTLRPRGREWVTVETASASFGQGISVTNLQLAMATSVIASGGVLMEPILVRRVTTAKGDLVREAAPKVRRRVIGENVARQMTEMLIAVTEDGGTGIEASINGHRVAGKTATAQKADPKTGHYSLDSYVSSFVGYVPAHAPEIVIAVTLDDPRIDHAGGVVAAPIFRKIAEMVLGLRGIVPRGTRPVDLKRVAERPDPGRLLPDVLAGEPSGARVQEVARDVPVNEGEVRLPNLVGVPIRSAMRSLRELGVNPTIRGSGVLVRQTPPPGAVLKRGEQVELVFEPRT